VGTLCTLRIISPLGFYWVFDRVHARRQKFSRNVVPKSRLWETVGCIAKFPHWAYYSLITGTRRPHIAALEEAMLSYDELVKLARFCANQARTGTEKNVRARAWRLAVEYRKDAAKLGEPPDIGDIPSDLEKA
jgi:hypothetical protein